MEGHTNALLLVAGVLFSTLVKCIFDFHHHFMSLHLDRGEVSSSFTNGPRATHSPSPGALWFYLQMFMDLPTRAGGFRRDAETINELAYASIWLGWEIRTALICSQHQAGALWEQLAEALMSGRLQCLYQVQCSLPRGCCLASKSVLCSGRTIFFMLNCPSADSLHHGKIQTGFFFFFFWCHFSVVIELRSLKMDT